MREPTEMELRVVKACCLGWAYYKNLNVSYEVVQVACSWPKCGCGDGPIQRARAAIRAMREPTKEMIAEGNDKIEYDLDYGYPSTGPSVEILSTSARDAWRAMIDAASPPE